MRTVVIGAGAAGCLAAHFAAKRGDGVTLIEKNEKIGKKIYITGKGRCNLTNDCDFDEFMSNVVVNGKFLYGAVSSFMPQDTMALFESRGLKLKVERGNRVFPLSDKSSDVIKTLYDMLSDDGVRILLNEKVTSIKAENNFVKSVVTENGEYFCDRIIVATGGVSYQSTGSTGDGYEFAGALGHTVIKPKPALVPFLTEGGFSDISGLTLKNVALKVVFQGKTLVNEFGELLFTHAGVSGPIVLTASSKINALDIKKLDFYIDLKPALDEKTLDQRVQRDFVKFSKKQLKNSLCDLLPSSLIERFLNATGVDLDKRVDDITKSERAKIVFTLKNFPLKVVSLADINEAIITSGGVSTKEIDPKTMESKLIKGLFFAGEVIDVDALTGGFNLQIAFSTGAKAGKADI